MSNERTAEAKNEVAALTADNAALVDLLLRTAGVLRDLAGMPMEADILADTAREPHPGAALLERVRRLEEALTEVDGWLSTSVYMDDMPKGLDERVKAALNP